MASAFDWKEFSQKTWVVILCIAAFPPLGLFVLWNHPTLGRRQG